MSEREARLREIRDRVEKATPGPWYSTEYFQEKEFFYPSGYYGVEVEYQKPICVVGAFDGDEADFIAHARDDVPWLLAEVERLQRELRIEQRRADELDGIGRETRKVLDRHQELASIDRDDRTPEQTEELHIARTSDLLIRTLTENEELRAEVERLRESETYAKLISQRIADENLELREELEKSKRFQSDIQESINKRAEARREKYRRQYARDMQRKAAFDYPGSAVDG